MTCGQRGRASPDLADHRPITRILAFDFAHARFHHHCLRSDKSLSRKIGGSSCEAIGGKLDALYFALGDDDFFVVVDVPSHVSITSLCVAAGASGTAHTQTVPLLTIAEMDKALSEDAKYRPPGH